MNAPKNSVKIFPEIDENKENTVEQTTEQYNNPFNIKKNNDVKGAQIGKKQGLQKNDGNQNKIMVNKKKNNAVKQIQPNNQNPAQFFQGQNPASNPKQPAVAQNVEEDEEMKGQSNGNKAKNVENLPAADPFKMIEQINKLKISENISKMTPELNPFSDGNQLKDYLKKEEFWIFNTQTQSDKLLVSYGPNIFKNMKKQEEKESLSPDFLERHKVNKCTRTRMVDWMMEIYHVFHCKPETLFLSIHILDSYLQRSKRTIKDEEIHLLGIGCIMLSSKYQEIYAINMEALVSNIGHKSFTEKVILAKEQDILKTINLCDFVYFSPFDFLMTFFYDFYVNNMKLLKTEKEKKLHQVLRDLSIYFSILCMHYTKYYKYKSSELAVGCVLAAYKTLLNKEIVSGSEKNRLSEYCNFIRSQNETSEARANGLADEIIESKWGKYDKTIGLNKSLSKFYYEKSELIEAILS